MQIPLMSPALRLFSSMVFPGAQVRVSDQRLAATLRSGEQRLDVVTSRGEQVAVVHRPPNVDPAGADQGTRYTLFLYGNAMTMLDTPQIRAVLADGGAGVVCVDYLGYGRSAGGHPSEAGCYRAAHAALTMIEERFGVAPGQVDVVGWSLGSAVALQVAASRPVRRLVLLSPFAGIAPYLLAPVKLNRTPLRRLGPFAGAGPAGRVSARTLLISGADDDLTPTWMAQDLAAAISGPAELVVVEGTGHNDLFTRPQVWKRILQFLAQ